MGLLPFWVYVGFPSKISKLYLYETCTKGWTFPGGMLHTHLFNQDREPMKDQSIDSIKTQAGEAMRFSGISYKSRKNSKTTASPKLTPDG